jgi:hypothetical protein
MYLSLGSIADIFETNVKKHHHCWILSGWTVSWFG